LPGPAAVTLPNISTTAFIAVVPFRSQTMLIGFPSGAQKWSIARSTPRNARLPTELATTLVPKLIDTVPAAAISDPVSAAG
jgi:hypothetical protein